MGFERFEKGVERFEKEFDGVRWGLKGLMGFEKGFDPQ